MRFLNLSTFSVMVDTNMRFYVSNNQMFSVLEYVYMTNIEAVLSYVESLSYALLQRSELLLKHVRWN